jgi:hypothetical protein
MAVDLSTCMSAICQQSLVVMKCAKECFSVQQSPLLLQGLALGMVRCGKRRFDDQWHIIGKMKLRALRIDCTGCNLPARTFSGVVAKTSRSKDALMVQLVLLSPVAAAD